MFNIANFITPFLHFMESTKSERWRPVFVLNGLISVPSIFLLAVYPWNWVLSLGIIAFAMLLNIVFIGFPLLCNLISKRRVPAHQAVRESLRVADILSFQDWLVQKGAGFYLSGLLTYGGLLFASAIVGHSTAMKEVRFDILDETSPTQIVIRGYEGFIVTKPIDVSSRTFDSRYQIVPLSEGVVHFKNEKIGTLTLK